MTNAPERRKYPRQDVMLAAMITPNGGAHDARVLNLSRSGACVDLPTDWTPSNGAAVKLMFQVDNDESVMVEAHIARIAVDHMGLKFDPGQAQSIRHLMEMTPAQ